MLNRPCTTTAGTGAHVQHRRVSVREGERTSQADRMLALSDPSHQPLAQRAQRAAEIGAVSQAGPDLTEQLLYQVNASANRAQPWPALMCWLRPAPVHRRQHACCGARIGAGLPAGEVLQLQESTLAVVLGPVALGHPDADDRRDL